MTRTKDRRPIRERLLDFYTENEAVRWLAKPHPQLKACPVLYILRDDPEPVHEILDRLESGGYL